MYIKQNNLQHKGKKAEIWLESMKLALSESEHVRGVDPLAQYAQHRSLNPKCPLVIS